MLLNCSSQSTIFSLNASPNQKNTSSNLLMSSKHTLFREKEPSTFQSVYGIWKPNNSLQWTGGLSSWKLITGTAAAAALLATLGMVCGHYNQFTLLHNEVLHLCRDLYQRVTHKNPDSKMTDSLSQRVAATTKRTKPGKAGSLSTSPHRETALWAKLKSTKLQIILWSKSLLF